jgi:transposase
VALSIVRRPRTIVGFEPLPRRWVIERSFAWLIKNRRLVRDFEQRVETSEALIIDRRHLDTHPAVPMNPSQTRS